MERNRDPGEESKTDGKDSSELEFGVNRHKTKSETNQCIYDGRLQTPSVKFMQELIRTCDPSKTNEKGGFGKVYFSKEKHPDLKIPVAVKEIIIEESSSKLKMMSTTNEKLASRTLHYAIVPLLAMTEDPEKRTFYFLSPFLENGDLFQALKQDTDRLNSDRPQEVLLTKRRRLKILFHIGSALDFLHTEVKGVRGRIIHMDVKSLNIVLDVDFNARLIDFGLAREMNETQSGIPVTKTEVGGSDGYFPTRGYTLLTVYEDYHNFGIVCLECLTGLPPHDTEGKDKDLRVQHAEKLKDKIQDMWYIDDDIGPESEAILELCEDCIESPTKKNMTSKKITQVLQDQLRQMNIPTWDKGNKQTNICDMCMINPADDLLTHEPNCCSNIEVCVACMRNSYVNKIRCHSCDEDIYPTIGHFWGALVIAGNDVKCSESAENFKRDALEVYKIIASKCPLVMGISPEDVVVVQADSPGQKANLKTKVASAVDKLSQRGCIKTLLVYYSGHSGEEGLILENDQEYLSEEELTEYIGKLVSSSSSFQFKDSQASAVSPKRLICIFDCCRPPKVRMSSSHVSVIQVNACRSQLESISESSGSVFTKFFIQALTQSAHGKKCLIEECDCSPIKGNFITVHELVGYIRRHMNRYQASRGKETYNAPEKHEEHVTWHDEKIAYNIDFPVQLKFKITDDDGKQLLEKTIKPHFISDVNELKRTFFETFIEKKFPSLKFEETELPVYQECICIEIDKGPKEKEELDTVEKIMKAWNAKRDLAVSLRPISRIQRGMTLLLIDPGIIRGKLDTTTLDNLNKCGETFSILFADLGKLKMKIGRKEKGALETFRGCLSDVMNACKLGTDMDAQLHIMIPRPEREKDLPFICFKLSVTNKNLVDNNANERSSTDDGENMSQPVDKQTRGNIDVQNKTQEAMGGLPVPLQAAESSELIDERLKNLEVLTQELSKKIEMSGTDTKRNSQKSTSETILYKRQPEIHVPSRQETQDDLPKYRMNRKPRGWCIIINNIQFESGGYIDRTGTEKDEVALKRTFDNLNFNVKLARNLSDIKLLALLEKYAKIGHTDFDCFVCAIMTHGEMNQVFGTNGRKVQLTALTSMFQASRCPTLAGKPKLFFIQSCQGSSIMTGAECGNGSEYSDERSDSSYEAPRFSPDVLQPTRTYMQAVVSDAGVFDPSDPSDPENRDFIPNEADFLLGYATLPGYVAFRNTMDGSWYIQTLCAKLDELAGRYDLLSILTEVNREVAARDSNTPGGVYKQIPAPMSTLRKRIIFS